MKKVKKPIVKDCLPVKLYINDIEKIVSIFDDNYIRYSLQLEIRAIAF